MRALRAVLIASALLAGCGEPEWTTPPPREGLLDEALAANPAPKPGAVAWKRHCAICHGATGGADGFNAPLLAARPPLAADLVARKGDALEAAIEAGSRAGGRSPDCPPWRGVLSRAEVEAVAEHVRELAATPVAEPSRSVEKLP